ncbi:MAG TPA: hypothetical protein VFS43_48180 [Polyangiaceae bacterium]|nr:hypothetical protein [Polyangiaceae bacterium]
MRAPPTPPRRRSAALAAAALALLAGAAEPEGSAPAPEREPCSLPGMVDDLRAALHDGSPALQKYQKFLLKEAAMRVPPERLRAAFAAERDPGVLEALGAAIASRASNAGEPAAFAPVVERARRDADPALRAASLRGLRGFGSVEAMAASGRTSYADFARDPAPEVRQAAAENLLHESQKVYFGHERAVSEAAVEAAAALADPALAAKLLAGTSMEQAGPAAVEKLVEKLSADDAGLRAAAAKALGDVSAAQAGAAQRALLERYRAEPEREVRAAILEGLAHLGLGAAAPTLESLRGVDPALAPEIDAWLKALATGLQEWSLIVREKQRLQG